ncbi:MAG: hypothetical protein EBQ67_00270 [Sphingobacteriia bacterium]|nr:hypothetical protein [Sphingomonadales bacterium]NBU72386.1 hypothetical protein [Bacteroidota bacterium]NBY29277.1 hypothetical protein [Sphingobacteriia bacterium]NDC72887.1 hypothetical protein [Sphingobacteriia bacterium]
MQFLRYQRVETSDRAGTV